MASNYIPRNKAVAHLARFIQLRELHRQKKEDPKHSVSKKYLDPIISQYRFCNVRRNDDRVTKWIFKNYMGEWAGDDKLWFALVVARLFNNEQTLSAVKKTVLPFKPEKMRMILHTRTKVEGLKNFNAAYIVSTNGRSMDKIDYIVDCVLAPMWKDRHRLTAGIMCGSLEEAHEVLSGEQGMGSFLAAQVLADLKYDPFWNWQDFHTFAASGPGSRRGLNRVMGRPVDAPWKEEEFRKQLIILRDKTNMRLMMDPLTAQDIQNCLCEYDKWCRALNGEGRPKQLYRPAALPWKEND